MSDIATAIVALLKTAAADSGVDDGAIAAAGIPDRLARPYIIYQVIGVQRVYSNDGPTGLARAMVQINCYGDTYAAARTVAKAVRETVNGYTGTIGGVTIQSLLIDDERDAPQAPEPGQSVGIPGVILTFNVAFNE